MLHYKRSHLGLSSRTHGFYWPLIYRPQARTSVFHLIWQRISTHLGRVTYKYVIKLSHHWFRQWRVACSEFFHKKINLEMSSETRPLFCFGTNAAFIYMTHVAWRPTPHHAGGRWQWLRTAACGPGPAGWRIRTYQTVGYPEYFREPQFLINDDAEKLCFSHFHSSIPNN